MTVDWLAIRNDYINGGGSYRKLAEKYGVSASGLMQKAAKEKWKVEREANLSKTEARTKQKTQEKISDALSEEAAAKSRIRAKLIRMAENWIDSQEDNVGDTSDYRRIVQSCVDMGIFDSKTKDNADKQNNLLQAIQTTEEITTDDLPEVE